MVKRHKVLIILIVTWTSFFTGNLQAQQEKPAAAQLRPEVEYTADRKRDPFQPYLTKEDTDPSLKQKEAVKHEPVLPTLVIQGIMWGTDNPLAIINNKVVRRDDVIDGARIIDINKNGVTVFFADRRHVVSAAAFGGAQAKTDEQTAGKEQKAAAKQTTAQNSPAGGRGAPPPMPK